MRNDAQVQISTLPLESVGYGAWSERDRRERPTEFAAFCRHWYNKIEADVQNRGDHPLRIREGDVVRLIVGERTVMGRVTQVFTIDRRTYVQTYFAGSFYVSGPNNVQHSAGALWSGLDVKYFTPTGTTDRARFWRFGDAVGADCGLYAMVDVAVWEAVVPEHSSLYRELEWHLDPRRNSIIVTHKDDPYLNGWIKALILFIAFVIVSEAASWLEGF